MSWVALILGILELLAPLLEDCGKERLDRAAKRLPDADTFSSEGEAAAALFDEAIAMTWRPLVRVGLRRAKAAAIEGKKLRKRPLSAEEMAEGKELAACIRAD